MSNWMNRQRNVIKTQKDNVVWIDPRSRCSCSVCTSDLALIVPCIKKDAA